MPCSAHYPPQQLLLNWFVVISHSNIEPTLVIVSHKDLRHIKCEDSHDRLLLYQEVFSVDFWDSTISKDESNSTLVLRERYITCYKFSHCSQCHWDRTRIFSKKEVIKNTGGDPSFMLTELHILNIFKIISSPSARNLPM